MEWDRSQYNDDLLKLAELIRKFDADYHFTNLNTLLDKAASKVNSDEGDIIKIDIKNIEVILKKRMSGSIPNNLDSITISLDSCCEFDTTIDIKINDRILKSYNFQIEIKGVSTDGDHYNSWHLDKHIEEKGDNLPKVTYPLYHFQAGGDRLEDKNISGVIFLGAPRIPHPPMDVVLGLHFILNNYFNSKDYPYLIKILNDLDYQEIIKRAQDRMFKPYFKAFETLNTHNDFTLKNVFPIAFNE